MENRKAPMKIQYVEPIHDLATPRKCSVCLEPATSFGFTANHRGAVNPSSKTPLCPAHSEL